MAIYHNDVWGTVCDDNWDLKEATVVCRQLGYGKAMRAVKNAAFREESGPLWYDIVRCTGRETSLTQCEQVDRSVVQRNFGCRKAAGVVCASELS